MTDSAALPLVAALESLEAGDVDLAVAILLGALEDGPRRLRVSCPNCGRGFEWPGQLDEHLRFDCPATLAELAAAGRGA